MFKSTLLFVYRELLDKREWCQLNIAPIVFDGSMFSGRYWTIGNERVRISDGAFAQLFYFNFSNQEDCVWFDLVWHNNEQFDKQFEID